MATTARKTRGEFVRELKAHWIIKVLAVTWLVLSAISTLVTYGPQSWQQEVSVVQYVPKWPWYVWAIGLLVLAFVVLFEASYRVYAGILSNAPATSETFEKKEPSIYIDFKPHIEQKGGDQTQTQTVAPATPIPTLIKEEPKPTHNIQLIRAKPVYVEYGVGSLGFYERPYKTSHKALVACFRNEPIFGRDDIVNANHVTATAHYFDSNEQEIFEGITGLYWLNDSHDCVDFEVGKKTHNAILAIIDVRENSLFVPFIKRVKSGTRSYNLLADFCLFRKEIAHVALWLISGQNQPLLEPIHFDVRKIDDELMLVERP